MVPVYVPTLPDLEPIPCPECQGEGGFEGVHIELGDVCADCGGEGEIDVCPNCHMQPFIAEGLEVCGCTVAVFALELGKVA